MRLHLTPREAFLLLLYLELALLTAEPEDMEDLESLLCKARALGVCGFFQTATQARTATTYHLNQ